MVKKVYKFRLYPTKEQADLINKTIGCSRFVANFVLAEQKKEEDIWATTNELVQQGFCLKTTTK